MRPIYDYYRQLKKLLGGRGRGSTRSKSQGSELALTTVSMVMAQVSWFLWRVHAIWFSRIQVVYHCYPLMCHATQPPHHPILGRVCHPLNLSK